MRMRVIRHLLDLRPNTRASIIAIAHFDGIHLGHQRLLQRAVDAARRQSLPALALDLFLPPSSGLPIESLRQRIPRVAEMGCESLVLQGYSARLQPTSIHRLLEQALAVPFGADTVFAEASLAAPILQTLHDMQVRHGFTLETVEPVVVNGIEVSNSAVRAAISAGELPSARRLLGRDPEVCGRVCRGFRRGHTIGFPTANLRASRILLPPNGVYAVRVRVGNSNSVHGGVANLGVNPTFGGNQRTLESHLFNFRDDLYGKRITVQLVQRLREERKFAGVEELVQQIRKDAVAARACLK